MLLGLAIQHNAFVERLAKYAAGIQMGLAPCIPRTWHDIAPKPAAGDGTVHLVVIQQSIADDEKIVIALGPSGSAGTAPEKDNGARMQLLHETFYRFGEPGILHRSALHTILYIGSG